MDKLVIKNLRLECIIGATPNERLQKQPVIITIELSFETNNASQTDNLEDALNYKPLYEEVCNYVEASEFFLIEKLAEEIAQLCLNHNLTKEVTITLQKPKVLSKSDGPMIIITRKK